MIKLQILNANGVPRTGKFAFEDTTVPMEKEGVHAAYVATLDLAYQEGDYIRVTTDAPGRHIVAKLDETLDAALVYMTDTTWDYAIPFTEGARKSIPATAFTGKVRNISVRYAKSFEITTYRNLALNTHDQKEDSGVFPHAHANVETRNDSTFFAKNAIDGVLANDGHGPYPYQSWGINRDPNAALTIDFGRKVKLDKVGIVLRTDFPHDSYWTQVTLRFACGTSHTFDTNKLVEVQEFEFEPIVTDYVVLEKLIKAEDESPFPALTQLELYGAEV